jgi:Domain of unknown function (DUF5122) beta-propeller
VVLTSVGPYDDAARDIVVQPDGRIVVAGYSLGANVSDYRIAVVRYDANGSPDVSFSEDGVAFAPTADAGPLCVKRRSEVTAVTSRRASLYSYIAHPA